MRKRNGLAFVVGTVATMSLGLMAAAGIFASASANAPTATTVDRTAAATVGDFAVQLASALQLPAPRGGHSAESASAALWKVGVKIQPDFRKALTESDVTGTLSQIGFNLTTEDPGRFVSSERSGNIINTFVNSSGVSDRIRSTAAATAPADDFNNGNGKGGKFKRKGPKSPGSDTTYSD